MWPLRQGGSTPKEFVTHMSRTAAVAVSSFQVLFGNYLEDFVIFNK